MPAHFEGASSIVADTLVDTKYSGSNFMVNWLVDNSTIVSESRSDMVCAPFSGAQNQTLYAP